ncbi:hypothetical protein ACFLTH_14070 [Bacteroidota bacterium]
MKSKKISSALLIIFLFSECLAGCSSPLSSEGSINYTQQTETLNVGSLELTYGLAVPDLADEGNGFPLILALHYSGNVTPSYGREFMNQLIIPALSELGARQHGQFQSIHQLGLLPMKTCLQLFPVHIEAMLIK